MYEYVASQCSLLTRLDMSSVRRSPLEQLEASLALVGIVTMLGDHVFLQRSLRVKQLLTELAAYLVKFACRLAAAFAGALVHDV